MEDQQTERSPIDGHFSKAPRRLTEARPRGHAELSGRQARAGQGGEAERRRGGEALLGKHDTRTPEQSAGPGGTKRRPRKTRQPGDAHSQDSGRNARVPQLTSPPPLRHWLGPRAFANMALRTAAGLRRNLACPLAPPRRPARIGSGRKPGC